MTFGDVYLWRQCTVLIADVFQSIVTGMMLTFPAVLNPAIIAPNTTDISATSDQASWIAASHGLSGVIGFFVIPFIMQTFGRRGVHIGINVLSGTGFIVYYFSRSVTSLFAARSIQGLSVCGVYITSIILSEYAHPTRRGYFITTKKGFVAVGSLIIHSLSLCWTWRMLACLALVPTSLAILITFLWPESPPFLALKGRFEECEKSYMWLNGNSIQNRKELEDLIAAQTERRNKEQNKTLMMSLKTLCRRDFLKPFFIICVLTTLVDACGRYYNLTYIIQIVTDITGDKSLAVYCSIGTDLLMLIALFSSCFIIRRFKRRTILYSSGYCASFFMFLISFFVYFRPKSSDDPILLWVVPGLICLQVFVVNAGVIPLCFTIMGEILPLEHKGVGLCTTGIVFTLLYALTMKCTPVMMDKTGIEGTYAIYGACVGVCLVITHFILMETKDRTLQEIEDEIKGVNRREPLIAKSYE